MEISLCWRGPLNIPNLQDAIGERLKELQEPHVYLQIQSYPEARPASKSIVYVGKATNMLQRMLQHYRGYLGLEYWLRDDHAEAVYCSGKRVEKINRIARLDNLEEVSRIAVNEVKRLKFFVAPCAPEYLKPVEAALISRVLDRKSESLDCDNGRREKHGFGGETVPIFSRPDPMSPSASVDLDWVLGPQPIVWH